MEFILEMFYCFAATFCFALIMNAPKKSLVLSSSVASVGYVIYTYLQLYHSPMLGFFLGTFFVAASGEIFARRLKMPATIFIFPGVIPIVPGLGLYETILALVQDDIFLAVEIGARTILNIGCMAIAMAFVGLAAYKIKTHKIEA